MATDLDEKCLFCLIVKGEANPLQQTVSRLLVESISGTILSFKVIETDHSLAFLDISPVSEGHTQVIPKYHARTLGELPDEYLRDIGPVIKKVALSTDVEQYNVMQNNGKLAFQHIDHVHFHVILKPNEKEGLALNLDDNWPMRRAADEDLAKTLEKMKGRI